MKNIFKFLGFIALVAVIGFSMAACGGGDKEAYIKVVNQNDQPITKVKVGDSSIPSPSNNYQGKEADYVFNDLNITNGTSQTFSVGSGWSRPNGRRVYVNYGDKSASFNDVNGGGTSGNGDPDPTVVALQDGETVTITLNADGTLTK